MTIHTETTRKENEQIVEANRRRFATPLRRAFKRLKVTRKKPTYGTATPTEHALVDRSNYLSLASEDGMDEDEPLKPPAAPRPSRWASPLNPPSPISPLPTMVSGSSNILTVRSGLVSASGSPGSIQGFDAPSSSSPPAPMPRGHLFQLGLTPVQSVRSIQSLASRMTNGEPLFAPALPTAQRVSTVNVAQRVSDMDIIEVLDMDVDTDARPGQTTPTPSRTSGQWLPSLSIERHAVQNPSTTAVFESSSVAQPRRTNFMSRLVGSAWGLAGIGFTSMHGHRRAQSSVGMPRAISPPSSIGNISIEQGVFGPNVTTSRLSTVSTGSRRNMPVRELPPANSTLRMTGRKSGRALDNLDEEPSPTHVRIEERPKKKMRGVNEPLHLSATPPRVTRSMAARQAKAEATTPTRVTRSTSKRLAELANTPTRTSYGGTRRSKSLRRL